MFNPTFTFAATVQDAAERINAPHEPKAVEDTADIINAIGRMREICAIGELMIRQTHYTICGGWLYTAGTYRKCPIQIGGELLDWVYVPDDMQKLHPFIIYTTFAEGIECLKEWYTAFQTIHPFEDGNGRVGGAIIAGLSLSMFNKILIPGEGI